MDIPRSALITRPGAGLHAEPGSLQDKAIGALLGLAIGDAVGTTLRGKPRDSCPPLEDMVGGGPFDLPPGIWTAPTAMALALADSLAADPSFNARDFMERLHRWWREGTYSATGTCFDIDPATEAALQRFEQTGEVVSRSDASFKSGVGSLVRTAPVAIWGITAGKDQMRAAARTQSATTHAARQCLDACEVFSVILHSVICGTSLQQALEDCRELNISEHIRPTLEGSWRHKTREQIGSALVAAEGLEAAFWCVENGKTYKGAVLLAANLGEHANTTGSITGQLAGAVFGGSGIPYRWRSKLAWGPRICGMAHAVLAVDHS